MPNHHYVPQSYLRRFSNARGQIRVYKTGTGQEPFTASIRKVASEVGFYRVDIPGRDTEWVESLLSRYESAGKNALDRILAGRFPPSPEDRRAIAYLLALQIGRTPENRRLYEMSVDRRLKMMGHEMNEDRIKVFLRQEGLDDSPESVSRWTKTFESIEDLQFVPREKGRGHTHMALMLEFLPGLAEELSERSWLLGKSLGASLITSDHPVLGFTDTGPRESLIGLGPANAETIIFPVDTRHILLLLSAKNREVPVTLKDWATYKYNQLMAAFSYRYIFQHPDDKRIHRLVPRQPREVARQEELEASILRVVSLSELMSKLDHEDEGRGE